MVDVRASPHLLVDPRRQDPAGARANLRTNVRDRLLEAHDVLPDGVQLLVIEGHRPISVQRRYFQTYRDKLTALHPGSPPDDLDVEASKHVSPPAVAPHPCGAAVDLTLSVGGHELDLGTPVNATPADSRGACFTAADNINPEARHWRTVLGAALSSAGLVNYPPEWWHWSYGDRYWAAVTGAPAALYAPLSSSAPSPSSRVGGPHPEQALYRLTFPPTAHVAVG